MAGRGAIGLAAAIGLLACSSGTAPEEIDAFPIYAGATLDAAATQAANDMAASAGQANKVSHVYFTADAFAKVAAFYLSHGSEASVAPIPEASRTLPDGREIQRVVVILDGAASLEDSNLWVNVQRPFIGVVRVEDGKPILEDVRDVTTIVEVERR
jgi:hypothetical protein